MSTKIEWTDETWNPVTGCTKVSQGCKNCYAERLAPKVFAGQKVLDQGVMRKRVFTDVDVHHDRFEAPLSWRKPRRVFVNSMSDLFHEAVTWETLDILFAVMALADRHTFQILTKRPRRMYDYFAGRPKFHLSQHAEGRVGRRVMEIARRRGEDVGAANWDVWWTWPLRNVWLGVSVEDQETADVRIPWLLDIPAAVRWISAEPLLGPIDLTQLATAKWRQQEAEDKNWPRIRIDALRGHVAGPDDVLDAKLTWVVTGGESGPQARPLHPSWLHSLRDQCIAAGVPFFFKQWGEWRPAEQQDYEKAPITNLQHEHRGYAMARVGKKAAGRLLDGQEYSEYPA